MIELVRALGRCEIEARLPLCLAPPLPNARPLPQLAVKAPRKKTSTTTVRAIFLSMGSSLWPVVDGGELFDSGAGGSALRVSGVLVG
jgi:hypothetical protein